MKIRIKFRKFGALKFIGHLDVMRFFQKAMRRAEVDIAYSGGYSPHQIMSFAAPLGVGLESEGEYLDIEVHSLISEQDLVDRLNAVSVQGIEIVSAVCLPDGKQNAMASVAAASYMVHFRKGYEPSFLWNNKVAEFMALPQILITKKTKKGEQEIDIRPLIFDMKAKEDGIFMMVNASSSGNIKPALVIEAYLNFLKEEYVMEEFSLCVTRLDTYRNAGDEEHPKFVPLNCME